MANTYAVITDAGVALQNRLIAGETLQITGVKAGAGSVPVTDLRAQTELQDVKQALSIVNKQVSDQSTVLMVQLTTVGLSSGYNLQQLGVYAKAQGEDEEILFAILQEEAPMPIPSETEKPRYAVTFYLEFILTNDNTIEININPAAYVTVDVYSSYEMTSADADEICI